MILELHVRNISLIPELSLSLGAGLTVITGETGAGKSILLGALSLLLGERATAEVIRTGCESASVEGLFSADGLARLEGLLAEHGLPECEERTLVIKREISRSGRGKCYVNGGLTTLAVLAELGEELVDLHGQHEHQSLLQKNRQRDLLDAWAELTPRREKAAGLYGRLRASREARQRLSLDEAERVRRLDMLNFQVEEIDAAKIKPGELEALQEERSRLANAEKLVAALQGALDLLHRGSEAPAVRDGLAKAADALASLARYEARLGEWADGLRAAGVQVAEVVDHFGVVVRLWKYKAPPVRSFS